MMKIIISSFFILSLSAILQAENSDNCFYYLKLGKGYHDQNDFKNALKYYQIAEKYAQINKEYEVIYNNIANVYLESGVVSFDTGKYNKAIIEFNNAITYYNARNEYLDNNSDYYEDEDYWVCNNFLAVSYRELGTLSYEKGKYSEAINFFYKALNYYTERNKYSDNYSDYNEDEDYRNCYSYLAYAYYYTKSYNNALECAEKLINYTSDNSLLLYYYQLLGDIYRDMKQYENAVFPYKQAISYGNNDYETYLKLGISLWSQEKYTEALTYFDKAVSLDYNAVDPNAFKGFCYSGLKEYANAIGSYKKAIQLMKNNSTSKETIHWMYFCLGESYYFTENYELAQEYLEKCLLDKNKIEMIDTKNDYLSSIYTYKAFQFLSKNDYKNADVMLQKALKIYPIKAQENKTVFFYEFQKIVNEAIQNNNLDLGIELLKKIAKYSVNKGYSVTNSYQLGIVYAEKEDYKTALGYLKNLIKSQYANEAEFLRILGICQYHQKDLKNALENLVKANNLKETKISLFYIGMIYKDKKVYDTAADFFTKAIEKMSGYSSIETGTVKKEYQYYNERAFCYEKAGMSELALADYKKALELGDIDAQVNIERLQKQLSVATVNPMEVQKQFFFSDVDGNIPAGKSVYENDTIAIVIGNKDYLSKIPSVDYALNDAIGFKNYLLKTFNIPEKNIWYFENLTGKQIESVFGTASYYQGKLYKEIDYQKKKKNIIIFYAGHGAPSVSEKKGYIVPIDGDVKEIEITGYSIEVLFNNLLKMKNEGKVGKIMMIFDSCFSGTSYGGKLLTDISPIVMKITNPYLQSEDSVVMFSSSGDEVSSWYKEANHSLFTYFLLRGLGGECDKDKNKSITLAELKDYLTENIPAYSRYLTGNEQHPQIYSLNDKTELIKLK